MPVVGGLRTVAALFSLAVLVGGCGNDDGRLPAARVSASNTYLEAVARELLGPTEPVLPLAGPGTCPGHFDISPAQVALLRRCRILLRFDFQKHFDEKLKRAVAEGLVIVPVRIEGGLCEPDSYLSACRQVGEALFSAGLMSRAAVDERLAEISSRITKAGQQARRRIQQAGLSGVPVLASNHQARFCRWLGLDVVATFPAADDPDRLGRAVQLGKAHGVRLVIGNVPEGVFVPNRLAKAIGAKVVMFDNFPSPQTRRHAFEAMLLGNVEKLLRLKAES